MKELERRGEPPEDGEQPDTDEPRVGTVVLVGRPNAGKSTLMNLLLAEKVAIVSSKPQTTRNRLVGILSGARGQMVFYDTPGVHRPQHRMNRQMVKAAEEALQEADVVCLLVDVSQRPGSGDQFMLEWVARATVPKIVLLNKIDLVAKPKLLPRIASYAETGIFEEIIPISALAEDGADLVLEALWSRLPAGPPLYDPELVSIHPERFLVAERIREKVLEQTRDELPFSIAVVVDSWEERDNGVIAIFASLLAERDGQRKILLGKAGERIKSIGIAARQDLEEYLDTRIYLDLRVRVHKNWREDERILAELERATTNVRID